MYAATEAEMAATSRSASAPRRGTQARWRRRTGAWAGASHSFDGGASGPRSARPLQSGTVSDGGANSVGIAVVITVGAAAPVATVRSASVIGSPDAAARAARPRSPVDG